MKEVPEKSIVVSVDSWEEAVIRFLLCFFLLNYFRNCFKKIKCGLFFYSKFSLKPNQIMICDNTIALRKKSFFSLSRIRWRLFLNWVGTIFFILCSCHCWILGLRWNMNWVFITAWLFRKLRPNKNITLFVSLSYLAVVMFSGFARMLAGLMIAVQSIGCQPMDAFNIQLNITR